MEIQKFKNINEALKNILPKDSEYIIVKHQLYKGQNIQRHFHKKATEWLVFNNGSLDIRSDDERETLTPKNETVTVKFMVSVKHSVDAIEDIEYFVIRDRQDEIYYSNRLF
ncbi:hypothetical protein HGB13_04225 [bacterium]|nr:hypothetical protein [bacterium]